LIMRFRRIFRRGVQDSSAALFDEAFLRRLDRLSLRTAPYLRGALWGERRSRNLRPTFDFSDHRPYAGGDDLRHVDWKVYGRHEELFVKLGEAPQSVDVHILLDLSPSMAWSSGQSQGEKPAKWDATRRLAGALGYIGLVGGERVAITPFGTDLHESFGPTRGKRRVVNALQFLAEIEPTPARRDRVGGPSLAGILTDYARVYRSGGLLILISDLLDPADPLLSWADEKDARRCGGLAEGLRHLPSPRWQVLVLHLLSRYELEPTLEGDVDLQDVETGERLPFHLDEQTMSRYRRRVHIWCDQVKLACAQRGASYSRVLAEWPFERAVIPYLRQRGAFQ
jgi:uncharacterized protein (DUF58 family)